MNIPKQKKQQLHDLEFFKETLISTIKKTYVKS